MKQNASYSPDKNKEITVLQLHAWHFDLRIGFMQQEIRPR
jgi:uncharacterized protein (UPF0128 family)